MEEDDHLTFAYECYYPTCVHYIDQEGRSYTMLGQKLDLNGTVSWIEDHTYKSSPFKFTAPARLSDIKLKWAMLKKGIRQYYDSNYREMIEQYLRKFSITYLVDMNNTDYANIVSLH